MMIGVTYCPDEVSDRIWELPDRRVRGLYALRYSMPVGAGDRPGIERDLAACGGSLAWYGIPVAWYLRLLLGRVMGERLRLCRPKRLRPGAAVDWWTVCRAVPGELVLATDAWFCGEAWLAYRLTGGPAPRLEQIGVLRPRGWRGHVYWWLLLPIHLVAFRLMVREHARRALRT
jgi:Protein of unknown function (DUF2867)